MVSYFFSLAIKQNLLKKYKTLRAWTLMRWEFFELLIRNYFESVGLCMSVRVHLQTMPYHSVLFECPRCSYSFVIDRKLLKNVNSCGLELWLSTSIINKVLIMYNNLEETGGRGSICSYFNYWKSFLKCNTKTKCKIIS